MFPCEVRRDATWFIERHARGPETYVGVALRGSNEGCRDAVEHVHSLGADAESPRAQDALPGLEPCASIIVRTGRGLRTYWLVRPPLTRDDAKWRNGPVAAALSSDPPVTDHGRAR